MEKQINKVYLYGADKLADVKSKKVAKQAIMNLFSEEGIPLGRLNYIFCSDEYLLDINRKHLNHDYLTDVITFPLSNKEEPVNGEVYLSVDRIKENAKQYNMPYQNELLRVMFHGALHLCGYNDKTKAAKQLMRKKEDQYLKQLSVSREANF